MSDKTNLFDNSKFDENWENLVQEMFMTGGKLQNNPEKLKEWSDEMLNKVHALTIGREITTEERKFYEDRIVPLSCMNKIIALFDKGFDSTYSEFLPEVFRQMSLCKEILLPMFIEMRDRILNELKEKNLYHKELEG